MTDARVLIVDDDAALLEALSQALQLRLDGLTVDTSDSAPAGLERIGATDYDAIVVDIKMPGMDGLQLLGEIRRLRAETPVLLITGHGDHEVAVQALRGGAYDYVTKPIDRDYFVSSLTRAIECHRLARDMKRQGLELQRRAKELEFCVQDRTHELRELLHREREARAALDEANGKLAEASRQRDQFVELIAHDLGGPLTTVRGYAEMLGRRGASADAQERARALIVSETRRMARLVQDLGDAAHLAAGRFPIGSGRCDLSEIAREQTELARALSDQHVIRLDAPTTVPLSCDRDRLGQVLANLIGNAIKYTAGGEILVRVWQEGRSARLSVNDEGPGIPVESTESIFEPGHRLSDPHLHGETPGSGLGLYIARLIVEAHGGHIWVDSGAGRGAHFHVALPLAGGEPTHAEREQPAFASG